MKAGDWVKRTHDGLILRVDGAVTQNYFLSGRESCLRELYTVIRTAEDGFRVGDKVRTDAAVPFTVVGTDSTRVRDNLGNWYFNETLTLIEPAPAHKFKVGNVVLPVAGYMRGKSAKSAKVIEVRECDGYVRIDTGAPWFLNPDALKHVLVPQGVHSFVGVDHAKPGSDESVRIECDLTTGKSRVILTANKFRIEPSLIKIKRTVKPGKYGRVWVDNDGFVGMLQDRKPTADELREAAHVLNQIAEVLDDVSE